jgi:hypothetical protein
MSDTERENLRDTSIDHLDRIEAAVLHQLGAQIADFRIILGWRGLVLRGLSRSNDARQLAQELAGGAAPYPIAANEIVVG